MLGFEKIVEVLGVVVFDKMVEVLDVDVFILVELFKVVCVVGVMKRSSP